jgi:D-glycero-alpha-D-manno-heptose 1-phosphate guanylyltransferase
VGVPGFEAIVLAGGLGTRISSVAPNQPKVMIDVGGHPFMEILFDLMAKNGVARVILATGHLHHLIRGHFGDRWGEIEIGYSVEEHPLGTGGAVRQALRMASQEDLFVLNGDTFFDVDFHALHQFHSSMRADITLALKLMRKFERYGTVELEGRRITGFREKRKMDEGLINGGLYLMNRYVLDGSILPEKFSLETDFLEHKVNEITIGGFVSPGYFIDIGIPEDYARARQELPPMA